MIVSDRFLSLQRDVQDHLRQTSYDHTVDIVGVTKYATREQTEACVRAGVPILGESRLPQAVTKMLEMSVRPKFWHFIGHLQRNKVKQAVAHFDLIQSIDRLSLLDMIQRECEKLSRQIQGLVQINVSKELQKYGFSEEELYENLDTILSFPNVKIVGIMVMAPNSLDPDIVCPVFRRARQIFDEIAVDNSDFSVLSMGMSQDYRMAILEGATMIRVGRLLFEEE